MDLKEKQSIPREVFKEQKQILRKKAIVDIQDGDSIDFYNNL